jgi:hypothetical protein
VNEPKLIVYYDERYAAPLGDHIMPIRKFGLVAGAVGELPWVELRSPAPVTQEELRRVHTPEYIEAIRTGEPRVLAETQKFPWSPQLFPSVCLTNGGCLAAARHALREGASAALVSGFHHACADHGEGFCTFNGLVVTADALLAAGEASRVAVLDLDLHYGNGTAQLAVSRPISSRCRCTATIIGTTWLIATSPFAVTATERTTAHFHCLTDATAPQCCACSMKLFRSSRSSSLTCFCIKPAPIRIAKTRTHPSRSITMIFSNAIVASSSSRGASPPDRLGACRRLHCGREQSRARSRQYVFGVP